jgi:hypothetical protein
LSAGIFSVRRRRRKGVRGYRLVVWRTYRARSGKERATTILCRDEIDPALAVLQKCGYRLAVL